MKKVLLNLLKLCCMVFVVFLFGCTKTLPEVEAPLQNDAMQSEENAENGLHDAENDKEAHDAESIITALTGEQMGGRIVGSEGNRLAAAYIADIFEKAGLKPLFDESFYYEYEETVVDPSIETQVTLIDADGKETPLVQGVDYLATAAFADVSVEAPLSRDAAACEDHAAVFITEDLAAAVSYVGDDYLRTAMYFSFGQNGAFYHRIKNPGGICIGLLNGKAYAKVREAEKVRIEAKQNARTDGKASNVAGYIPGSEGNEAFVIMAHFDGSGTAGDVLYPSAYDNASGTAALLRTAILFAERESQIAQDVIFLATNGEESGMSGADAFNEWLEGRYEQVNCINIDCIGYAGRTFIDVYTDDTAEGANPLAEALAEKGADLGAKARHEIYTGDNRVVHRALCATLSDWAEGDSGVTHHPNDVAALLDPSRIEETAVLIRDFLFDHSGPLYVPVAQPSESQTESADLAQKRLDMVEKYGLSADEFVIVREDQERYRLYFGQVTDTYEAISDLFPELIIPETIADYKLISTEVYSGWMKSGTAKPILVGNAFLLDGLRFAADRFEAETAYPVSALKEAGALNIAFDLLYESAAGKLWIRLSAKPDLLHMPAPEEESAALLLEDESFADIQLQTYEKSCICVTYYPEGASVLVFPSEGISFEDMAELLTELDIKGMADALKG